MPLDTSRQDLERLSTLRGFKSSFIIESNGLSPLAGDTDGYFDLATDALDAWYAISTLKDADILILRFEDRLAVVTPRAGLVIFGDKTLNAGILRQIVKKLPKESLSEPISLKKDSWTKAQLSTWALAERLGRVEAARTFELMIGEFAYVIEANRDSIGIVEEDGGMDRLLDQIALANKNGHAIEYTLGEPKKRDVRSTHHISELFGQSDDETWKINRDWPVGVPSSASFSNIKTATAFCNALSVLSSASLRADLLDEAGQTFLSMSKQGSDGVLKWQPSIS